MVPDNIVLSTEFQIIMTIIYSLSILVSVLGNSTVIYIVYKHKDMRTTTNLLLVNMACADLLVAILYMVNQLKYLFLHEKWFGGVIGLIFCKPMFVIQYLPACGTVWSTAVISIDRLSATISPLKKSFISNYCKTIICSIWLISLLLLGHLFFRPQVLFIKNAWLCVFRSPFAYFVYFRQAIRAFMFPVPLVIIILSYCYLLSTAQSKDSGTEHKSTSSTRGCNNSKGFKSDNCHHFVLFTLLVTPLHIFTSSEKSL